MAAIILEIADEVVSILNGASLSQSFTAVRRYQPRFTLEELETLRVSVVPKSIAETLFARKVSGKEIAIDIGVQKKTEGADSEYDDLMLLTEEISDLFIRTRLSTPESVAWKQTANDPIYSVDDLNEQQVFLSVVTITFTRTKVI